MVTHSSKNACCHELVTRAFLYFCAKSKNSDKILNTHGMAALNSTFTNARTNTASNKKSMTLRGMRLVLTLHLLYLKTEGELSAVPHEGTETEGFVDKFYRTVTPCRIERRFRFSTDKRRISPCLSLPLPEERAAKRKTSLVQIA